MEKVFGVMEELEPVGQLCRNKGNGLLRYRSRHKERIESHLRRRCAALIIIRGVLGLWEGQNMGFLVLLQW